MKKFLIQRMIVATLLQTATASQSFLDEELPPLPPTTISPFERARIAAMVPKLQAIINDLINQKEKPGLFSENPEQLKKLKLIEETLKKYELNPHSVEANVAILSWFVQYSYFHSKFKLQKISSS